MPPAPGNAESLRPAALVACVALLSLIALAGAIGWAVQEQPSPPTKPRPEDVPGLLKVANDALDRRDLPAAVKALTAVLEVEPEMPEAWFNLAYAYTGLNRDEEAAKAYQKTVELQPDLFEARLNLGILFIEMKRLADAGPHLAEAVKLKPDHARAHLYYGRALSSTGNADAAAREFEEALRLDPALAIAHFDLGQVHLAKKDFDHALAAFQKAAELDPELPQASLGIALALEGLNRHAEAIAPIEKYLVAKPDDLETRFHLVRIYLQERQVEKALENLQAIYRANPSQKGVVAALGDVHASLLQFAESEKYYREALRASPDVADLHRALGQTLIRLEKFPEAEVEFRACLKLEPKNPEAFRGLATSLYLQKRYAEAIPLLETQGAASNPSAGLFFLLASSYDHLHEAAKALQNYERFLQLSQNQNPDQEWQARQRVKLLRRALGK